MTIHEQKKDGLPAATTDSAAEVGLPAQAGYITLKEASERFGYAPDYIGQLIRKGKIEGKQVYANVAWVTTEEAMEAYKAVAGEKRAAKAEAQSSRSFSAMFAEYISGFAVRLFSPRMTRVIALLLRSVLVLLVLVLVVAFYLLSVAFDRAMAERAEERLERNVKSGRALVDLPRISYEDSVPFRL